jgi:hypothetical protein
MNGVNIKAQVNGKVVTIKGSCASCWEELKTYQYIRILKEWEDGSDIADRDYFKLFDILTDGKFTSFEKTVENEVTLINLIGWVITQPFEFSQELPKVLVIGDKVIDIPRHPRDLSIGQNIHLRRDYIEKTTKIGENIAIATAIYLQPIVDNSLFSLKRAQEICKEIEQMPINLIYPIGFFLLESAMRFGQTPEKTWLFRPVSLKQMFGLMWHIWRR